MSSAGCMEEGADRSAEVTAATSAADACPIAASIAPIHSPAGLRKKGREGWSATAAQG